MARETAGTSTATKIFCGCPTAFGAPPNTHVCPVCLGMPGALPVLNRRAADFAVTAALALGCDVHERSIFARKNYFYPDLPKGYQISQYEQPLATGGRVDIEVDGVRKPVRLTRIHMEEDAGKSLHEGFPDSERQTYLDYNRAGVPLIEIVSEPDMRSAAEAAAFFEKLRQLLVWLGVNDGNMEEGSLRCDANVSVRPVGADQLGTKTEVKNVNSFRHLEKAIGYEIGRQIDVLEHGGRVVQETRLFDAAQARTYAMRSKEGAHDYRYFPEPDLPPLVIDETRKRALLDLIPELPEARMQRYVEALGLPVYDANLLTQSRPLADYFEETACLSGNPKAASNWVMGELLRTMKERDVTIEDVPLRPARLAGLIGLVESGLISSTVAKDVFVKMYESGRSARQIVDEEGLAQIGDTAALGAMVTGIVAANPDAVEQVRKGRNNAFGFLVGQVMKASKGKANPKIVNELLVAALRDEPS
ncbi:MAG: Asp-tRNA(Asn)/Glu-tRNA(Gln) amidotransferase subunit GatB [Acidobacteria bacterium]|nr:Asp-tRNA(Asn)/Glu-tRNA(Gln) amidotransferase subunit GatB [Acidobacteriota bacterium]